MLTITRDGRVLDDDVPLDVGDPSAPLSRLSDVVTFAPDLTVADTMRALRPWADVLSTMSGTDFVAWYDELARARLRVVEGPAPDPAAVADEPPVTSVTLRPYSWRSVRDGHVTTSVEWRCHGGYARPWTPPGAGVPVDGCALPGDTATWCSLPLVLDGRLVEEGCPGPGRAGDGVRVEATFFDAVVMGFLSEIGWEGSPDDVRRNEEEALASLREVTGPVPVR